MNPFRAWLLHPRGYGAALLHFDWLDSAGELMMTSTGCALGAAERSKLVYEHRRSGAVEGAPSPWMMIAESSIQSGQ